MGKTVLLTTTVLIFMQEGFPTTCQEKHYISKTHNKDF